MSLSNKIEEIRKKPEREKMKYVWGMVAICMFFIICVWVISVKNMMRGGNTGSGGGNVFNSLESISDPSVNPGSQENSQMENDSKSNPYYNKYESTPEASIPANGFGGE